MPDSLVVQVMRQHKAALLAREAAQMRVMARRWLEVESALEGQLSALAQETAGAPLTQGQLYRRERFQSLLSQAKREMERYAGYAEGLISEQQGAYGRLGIEHAAEAVQTTFREAGRVGPYFNRLPIESLELMAGLAGDGSPLRKLLMESWPAAADGLTRSLLKGVALGWGPQRTAKAMREQMATGLERALTIARTETLRTYRAASDEQYRESGVVLGKRRLVAKFGACAACLARDNELVPLDEPAYDHPNGRCTFIPVVDGMPAPQWQKGPEWFREQPEAYQRQILGQGRYEAWKDGKFDFADLARDSHSQVWGRSLGVRPLKDLVSGASGGAAVTPMRRLEDRGVKLTLGRAGEDIPPLNVQTEWAKAVNDSLDEMDTRFGLRPGKQLPLRIGEYEYSPIKWADDVALNHMENSPSLAHAGMGRPVIFTNQRSGLYAGMEAEYSSAIAKGRVPLNMGRLKDLVNHELAHPLHAALTEAQKARWQSVWQTARDTGRYPTGYWCVRPDEGFCETVAAMLRGDNPFVTAEMENTVTALIREVLQ